MKNSPLTMDEKNYLEGLVNDYRYRLLYNALQTPIMPITILEIYVFTHYLSKRDEEGRFAKSSTFPSYAVDFVLMLDKTLDKGSLRLKVPDSST